MVSIIIPVYNVEEYIEECLKSILAQTYKDIELLIVDDGSTDNSLGLIREYENKFKKIRIFTQQNKGVSEARNLALNYVSGEFVLYIDPDDFLEPNMIEKMVNKAEKYNSDITICGYYLYYSKDNANNKIFTYGINENKTLSSLEVIDMMLNYKLQGQLWNKLFKKDLLINNNFKFEPGRYIQDIFPVFKMVLKSSNITFIDEPLYYYRQRMSSTVNKKSKKLAEDYFHAMYSIMNYVKEENIKVNKNSYIAFRTIVLSNFIAMYTNYKKNDVYKYFYKSEFKKLDIKIHEFISLNNIPFKDKLRVVLWRTRVFNFIKNLKNK
ncbi:MAG: glycosyltransferase family 2 protein [Clostridium sp.]|jgi:glycosyltransferase involved in cell wall biosynthesis|nr:glycosyltransferase [Clostridium sp.]